MHNEYNLMDQYPDVFDRKNKNLYFMSLKYFDRF